MLVTQAGIGMSFTVNYLTNYLRNQRPTVSIQRRIDKTYYCVLIATFCLILGCMVC